MLTLFFTPKAFQGHNAIIQRNALATWKALTPPCEILLMGRDPGSSEAAEEFRIRHVPDIQHTSRGTPLLNDLFRRAQREARHDVVCYINADILLLRDFLPAVHRTARESQRFLMVGQRVDLDVTEPLDFGEGWEERLRRLASAQGRLHPATGIDYFVFRRGHLVDLPPFAIGRTAWDNWILFHARRRHFSLVDATPAVTAIHQNHDYAHVRGGTQGAWKGPEALRNRKLAGGRGHAFTISDATHTLTPDRLRRNLDRAHLRRYLETAPSLFPAVAPLPWTVDLLRRMIRLARTGRNGTLPPLHHAS